MFPSGPATKARRGLGYKRKIRNSVGYLMRNEISLSLSSYQSKQGIISTDTLLSQCCLSLRLSINLVALCFPMLQLWDCLFSLFVICILAFSSYFLDFGSGQHIRKLKKLHILKSDSIDQVKKLKVDCKT